MEFELIEYAGKSELRILEEKLELLTSENKKLKEEIESFAKIIDNFKDFKPQRLVRYKKDVALYNSKYYLYRYAPLDSEIFKKELNNDWNYEEDVDLGYVLMKTDTD